MIWRIPRWLWVDEWHDLETWTENINIGIQDNPFYQITTDMVISLFSKIDKTNCNIVIKKLKENIENKSDEEVFECINQFEEHIMTLDISGLQEINKKLINPLITYLDLIYWSEHSGPDIKNIWTIIQQISSAITRRKINIIIENLGQGN